MIEAIIYNISVTVAGIYLFHRLQYSETKQMKFSQTYVTILMTVVALLLAAYPIPVHDYLLFLTFVPLLFLGRYTNVFFTMVSATIIFVVDVFVYGDPLAYNIALLIIALAVSFIGPFIKQNDIVSLQILNAISLIILSIISIITKLYTLQEIIYLIPISFVVTIASSITFVDIWRFFTLVQRYESEDRYDYLTGLGNVKEFDRYLNKMADEAEDKSTSLGLLLIDIDGFKDVNDAFTHRSGDAVLKQISQLLINYVPPNVRIFRNGGEEFSVVVLGYSLDQSVKLAESIRAGVEKSTFHLPDKEVIKLSVSIGIGYLTAEDYKSQRKVFKDADDMLHMAKNEGRNQVMFNPIVKS